MHENDKLLINVITECFVQMLCTPAPTSCQLQEKEVWPQQPGACSLLSWKGSKDPYIAKLILYWFIYLKIHLLQNWFYTDSFCLDTWTAVEAKEEDQVDDWIRCCLDPCSAARRVHWMYHGDMDEFAMIVCRFRPLALLFWHKWCFVFGTQMVSDWHYY